MISLHVYFRKSYKIPVHSRKLYKIPVHSKESYELPVVQGVVYGITKDQCEIHTIKLHKTLKWKNELHIQMNEMDQIYLPSHLVLDTFIVRNTLMPTKTTNHYLQH